MDDGQKQIKMYDPDQDEKKKESADKTAEADESVELAQNF